jgi:streptogramin lyase
MQSRLTGCTLAAVLVVLLVAQCFGKQLQSGLQEQDTWKVLLPKGSQPEGIAAGAENDIWVACLSGSVIHVVSSSSF